MTISRVILSHVLSSNGIEVDKANVEVILNLPSPKTAKKVCSFLGHAGFYRRFIKNFNVISRPLCNLIIKDKPFKWTEDFHKALEKIISLLTSTPIMQPHDWFLPFKIMCDSSDYIIGVVLGQRKERKYFVIYYASRTLKQCLNELHYH